VLKVRQAVCLLAAKGTTVETVRRMLRAAAVVLAVSVLTVRERQEAQAVDRQATLTQGRPSVIRVVAAVLAL